MPIFSQLDSKEQRAITILMASDNLNGMREKTSISESISVCSCVLTLNYTQCTLHTARKQLMTQDVEDSLFPCLQS